MRWLALIVMLLPAYSFLALLGWVVMKLGDKVQTVLERIEAVDTVDDFAGELRWPIEPDEWLMDGLRDEAGDWDDRKRQQFEAIVLMGARRH